MSIDVRLTNWSIQTTNAATNDWISSHLRLEIQLESDVVSTAHILVCDIVSRRLIGCLQWENIALESSWIVDHGRHAGQSYRATLCLKNDTDVAHYNFNAHKAILIIFGRDVAERVRYEMVICYPIYLN